MTNTVLWVAGDDDDRPADHPISCAISDDGELRLTASYRLFRLSTNGFGDPVILAYDGFDKNEFIDITAKSPAGEELIKRGLVWTEWTTKEKADEPICSCGAVLGHDEFNEEMLALRVIATQCAWCGGKLDVDYRPWRKATAEDVRELAALAR